MTSSNYPTDFLNCRTVSRHAWDEIPATEKPPWGVFMWFRCTRCHTVRKDIFNRFTGEMMSRRYVHPTGYKLEGPLDFREIRAAYLQRRFGKQDADRLRTDLEGADVAELRRMAKMAGVSTTLSKSPRKTLIDALIEAL